jgi:acyl carrier protein
LPERHEFRKTLKERGIDPKVIAEIEETEGDSLDFVEITMALEESLGITFNSE